MCCLCLRHNTHTPTDMRNFITVVVAFVRRQLVGNCCYRVVSRLELFVVAVSLLCCPIYESFWGRGTVLLSLFLVLHVTSILIIISSPIFVATVLNTEFT